VGRKNRRLLVGDEVGVHACWKNREGINPRKETSKREASPKPTSYQRGRGDKKNSVGGQVKKQIHKRQKVVGKKVNRVPQSPGGTGGNSDQTLWEESGPKHGNRWKGTKGPSTGGWNCLQVK